MTEATTNDLSTNNENAYDSTAHNIKYEENEDDADDDKPPILVNTDEINDPTEEKQEQEQEQEQEEQDVLIEVEAHPHIIIDSNQFCQIIPDLKNAATTTNTKKRRRVPLTILTGFLGSGKTTLIQNIISTYSQKYKIAIIENEYSPNGTIESLILKNGLAQKAASTKDPSTFEEDDIIELANGCLCCSLKSNLVETIENLLRRKPTVNYILLETSGLAKPGPIATTLWFDQDAEEELSDQCVYLDGIIAMVDVKNILFYYEETRVEVEEQLAYADCILVNKMDLVEEGVVDVEVVRKLVRSINPNAVLYPTTYSKLEDMDGSILNIKSMDSSSASNQSWMNLIQRNIHSKIQLNHTHTNQSRIGTITLYSKGSVSSSKINSWLATILWPNQDEHDRNLRHLLTNDEDNNNHKISTPKDKSNSNQMYIFRIKGILAIRNDNDDSKQQTEEKCIVQAIDDTWEIYSMEQEWNWKEDDVRFCQLIIIGRCLDTNVLQEGFNECFL